MPREARFQPFAETGLRIRVTVELLCPDETHDVFVMHDADEAAEDGAREAISRARQLLAVAFHTLGES